MTNQRTQEFNQRSMDRQMQRMQMNRAGAGSVKPMSPEEQLKAQAKQQQAEQAANDKLTHLAQEQQRKRLEHPAKNPHQADLQQKKDEKQLNQLAVKNYRDVFLTGQISKALQAQKLAPQAQQTLKNINENLLKDAWWSKQEGAQLSENIKAYSDSLTSLTAGLLGFDLASPPPAPSVLFSSRIDGMLAKAPFDQNAATQLLQEAALADKLLASDGLIKAVMAFKTMSSSDATKKLQSNPKKLRKEVTASLRRVNAEMKNYDSRIASSKRLYAAEDVILQAISSYLAEK